MTEKKPKKVKVEMPDDEEEVMEKQESTKEVDEMTALQEQLEETLTQAAEFKDGWQRARAEFDNYRKRIERENSHVYQNAVGNVVKRYLPVMDDLERALAARPEGLAWADGIDLIYRKLQSILDSEGVKRIEAVGEAFDPNFHEAIGHAASNDIPSGCVTEVVQNGYILGEKVLRPALVRVAE
jgi:molecular chaperone GrpE